MLWGCVLNKMRNIKKIKHTIWISCGEKWYPLESNIGRKKYERSTNKLLYSHTIELALQKISKTKVNVDQT